MKRRKEEIKTMHALGKLGYKEAKETLESPPEEEPAADYSKFALDPMIFNELVRIAREILEKNKDADPDTLLKKFEGNKRVKELLKSGAINEGDLRDALNAVSG